jgi:aspartate aminotransferase-like enzyme
LRRVLTFKVADRPEEIAQLQALHYRTFVEEIPQYGPNDDRRHVDKFHDQNVYLISLDEGAVVGSLSIRCTRPFSLDQKLPNLDEHLPAGRNPCEVRLLAIEKEHRTGPVLPGLLNALWDYAMAHRFDCAVISATTRQLKLYSHLGFAPFGPLVGTAEAPFQPMIVTLERFRRSARELASLIPAVRGEVASYLTGPVPVHPDVAAAFAGEPQSHRGEGFADEMRALQAALCALTSAKHVDVLLGSGTLANDVVAAQLSLLGGAPGVVVSNGEFGERLADHAMRHGLAFEHLRFEWGAPLDLEAIAKRNASWIWAVACETSTGVLNDIVALERLGERLCVDAVSAIGAVPLDLSRVYLVTGASGKSLAAYPGLSMVFRNHDVAPADTLPRYLDLGLYATSDPVPFTHSSNLVHALRVAVDRRRGYAEDLSLRARLRAAGLTLVGEQAAPAPHVVTIAVRDSEATARALEKAGFLVAWASGYLRERNWIQIALMGEVRRAQVGALVRKLAELA